MRTIITGAASGIGRHLTGLLAKRGYTIIAADANQDGLAAARAEDRWPESVTTTYLDVTNEDDWAATFDFAQTLLRGVDVLMNVAGVLRPGFVLDVDARDYDLTFGVNVKGIVLGTREAARRMVAAKLPGHIVNFGSLASLTPVPGLSIYCASKWAVRGFSLSAAVELEEHGIGVTLVCPDAVQTPMLDIQKDREEAALTFSGSRALTVEEVGQAIVEHVLPKRPTEITLPLGRGLLARIGGIAPGAAQKLYPMMKKKGQEQQKKSR